MSVRDAIRLLVIPGIVTTIRKFRGIIGRLVILKIMQRAVGERFVRVVGKVFADVLVQWQPNPLQKAGEFRRVTSDSGYFVVVHGAAHGLQDCSSVI